MRQLIRNSIMALAAVLTLVAIAPVASAQDTSTKKERNYIRSGNKLFNEKRYAEAEVEYNKALQANPSSAVATFNLATTLLRQGGASASKDDKNNPANRAESMLENLVKSTADNNILSKAYYDLGNIAYKRQDYKTAVECYKNALRRNPGYNEARDNLRLAQLHKNDEKGNNDNNQNQDKDQNKDQNKDKDKNKDQDKNKNQDKNQDKNKDQNKDKDKNKDQDKGDQPKQQPQQPQQGNMSQQNVEQILKTMQDKENATQQRMQAVQAQQQRNERQRTNRKW